MSKKATTKTGATGTMVSTGVNDPTCGGGNNPFDGTEGVPNDPTAGTATEVGRMTPTGGGGTSGLSDKSFDDDFGVKKRHHALVLLTSSSTFAAFQKTQPWSSSLIKKDGRKSIMLSVWISRTSRTLLSTMTMGCTKPSHFPFI
jgi:hypothetical protein